MYKRFLNCLTLPIRVLLVVITYLIMLIYSTTGVRKILHKCEMKCCLEVKPFIIKAVVKPCWSINKQNES